jgi:RND family efflux transporter MFP subunit
MLMNLRVLTATGLLVLGVGAVAFAVFRPSFGAATTDQYLTAAAAVSDVADQAVATGTVAATRVYGLAFGADPHIADSTSDSSANGSGTTWLVDDVSVLVGQNVTAGEVLATADTTEAQRNLDLAQANLDAAQARYDADTGGISESDRDQAQIAVDQAEQQLESAKQSRDETARQNDIQLQQARDAVSDAQDKLGDDRDDGVPKSVIKADRDAVASAQDSLDLEKIQVESSNRQAQDQVDSAQLSLDSANNSFESQTSPASDEQIASDKASLLTAQQQLDDAQTQLDGAAITSPVDGTVIAVNVVEGVTYSGGDALEVMSDELEVTADFSESDLPAIALGQSASITISATESELTGTVTEIAESSSTSGSGSVVSYPVTITLTDVPAAVRPGMSADVAVTTAEVQGVLAIPSAALNGNAGNYTVNVIDLARNVSTRPVEVGLVTTSLAEIKSGLTAGEEVVTGTTSSLNGGTQDGGFFPGGGPRVIQGGGPSGGNGGTQVGPPQ